MMVGDLQTLLWKTVSLETRMPVALITITSRYGKHHVKVVLLNQVTVSHNSTRWHADADAVVCSI